MTKDKYTVPFLVSMIQNRYKIGESRFFKADLSACDMLMDLDIILLRSKLTAKQQYILENYWVAGYTQEEVAKTMQITQQMIEKHCRAMKKKMKKILKEMGEVA